MKRSFSMSNSELAFAPAAPPVKRRRRHSEIKYASKPLALTHEALAALRESPSRGAISIERWMSSSAQETGMDANQPHPRLAAPTLRRAKARTRTPSPVKKSQCANPEYRNGTMKLAEVFVERDPEPPTRVVAYVGRILGTDTTEDVGGQEEDVAQKAHEAALAEAYRLKCQSLAGDCTAEGEWRSSIYLALIDPLIRHWSPVLKLSASEKPWNKHLKPVVPHWSIESFQIPVFPTPASASLSTSPTAATTLSQHEPWSSNATSVTASEISLDGQLQLSTPKPDVTIGLKSDAIKTALNHSQDILLRLQNDPNNPQPFVSDPHQVPLGLRFPFCFVEAKGPNTGSTLVHAQNQAAVVAASALNILNDLNARAALASEDDIDAELSSPTIVFSVTTEGPTHELWVHYQIANEYHMNCLQSWRMTLPGHAEKFVRCLAQIMRWGAGVYRQDVVEKVGALLRGLGVPVGTG